MWIWRIRLGSLHQDDTFKAKGYSGAGQWKNDPNGTMRHGEGPIPTGVYIVGETRETTERHGPVVLPLTPIIHVQTFGRSNFLVHGDNVESPGSASHGCIILARPIREEMAYSRDKLLVVLSGNEVRFVA